jgi:phospholipase/lecithinase/hemolysin
MAPMDIQAEKLYLIEQLTRLQDARVIKRIKEILQDAARENIVGYNPDGSVITESDLISRAEASGKAIRDGRTKTIDQVRKNMKDW